MNAEKYWVYMKQADRRIYPCVVIRDEKGMTSVAVAQPYSRCSVVTAAEAEILKTFHGADRLHLKRAKPGLPPKGKWGELTHPKLSYAMFRDLPLPVSHIWQRLTREHDRELQKQQVREKPSIYHPHTMSGFK
jgi:hypothetical protein